MAPVLKYRDPGTGEFVPVPGESPPVGAIIAYVGTDVPDGWHVCDGTAHGSADLQAVIGSANTPDLRDRFVVGAGPTMAAGTTGGAATATLTGAQTGTPAHNHTASTSADSAAHTHTFTAASSGGHTHASYWANFVDWADLSNTAGGEPAALSNSSKGAKAYTNTGAEGGVHTHGGTSGNMSVNHTHTMAANASATNAGTAHENRPPYYAMVYLIRGE